MRPGHPQWPDFYSRLTEAFTGDTGKGEFTPNIRRIHQIRYRNYGALFVQTVGNATVNSYRTSDATNVTQVLRSAGAIIVLPQPTGV